MTHAAASPARGEVSLIFDGDCGFCTTWVERMAESLPAFPPAVPYQWADLDELGMSVEEAAGRVWLITPERHYGGHRAVAALLRRQPFGPWRFLGWLMVTPPFSWAAALGYAVVARFRHLLPGGTPACQQEPR